MANPISFSHDEAQTPLRNLEDNHNQEYQARVEKLRALSDPYPNNIIVTHFCGDLIVNPPATDSSSNQYTLAGRILFKRIMGKALFLKIQDFTGTIQCYARIEELSSDLFEDLSKFDIGDHIAVTGFLFYTRTQELTLHICSYRLTVKCLRPLPDKYHGITDPELKYRQRYLDLITDSHSREIFRFRSNLIHLIREFFIEHRFLEVETPMMHAIPGGANARPFITHHNALDIPLYLRIAPELFLKRLVVGGFERVFEINRNFRNEGVSSRHNPEFTMIEFYQAYADYRDMMDLTQELFYRIAEFFPSYANIVMGDFSFSLKDPIPRLSLAKTLEHFDGMTAEQSSDSLFLMAQLARSGPPSPLGVLQLAYFEKFIEHRVISPLFVTDYPVEVSPLARRSPSNPAVTERFELFIAGREVANGFSELNDPFDQAERFMTQVQAKEQGDSEAMFFDKDYIEALEYGLPPTAGQGIGIDRLIMLLTGKSSIKDVILFPTLKPKD